MAEDSEIEIRYEYYRETKEKFNFAGLRLGPSDNILMDVNYFSFDAQNPESSSSRYNGINLLSELKWKIKEFDFKFTPEFARTVGEGENGSSIHLRTDISTEKVRIFSQFEKYDDGFKTLHERKFQLGKLKSRITAGGTFYPVDFLDIYTNWSKKSTPEDNNGKKYTEENIIGKILLSKKLFPAVSFSAARRSLYAQSFNSKKDIFKGDLVYRLPHELLKKTGFKSVWAYAVWRKSFEDISDFADPAVSADSKKIYDNQYLRLDISPADRVQINTYIRTNSIRLKDPLNEETSWLLSHKQKLFLDATIDRIKGTNISFRYKGEISKQYPDIYDNIHNLNLYRSFQSSIRIYPGNWIKFFAPFTFEINYQPAWRGYLQNLEHNLSWSEKFLKTPGSKKAESSEENKLYQLRGEWRPSASLFFYSGYDTYRIISSSLSSTLRTNKNRINQKLEYRPSMHSLITLHFIRDNETKLDYSKFTRNNSMLWIENRRSQKMHTKLNFSYLHEKKHTGNILEKMSNFSALFGITYRIPEKNSTRHRAELRNDISTVFYRSNKSGSEYDHNSISNAFAVDYFPSSVLIVRLRVVSTYRNILRADNDTLYNTFELRLSAQF